MVGYTEVIPKLRFFNFTLAKSAVPQGVIAGRVRLPPEAGYFPETFPTDTPPPYVMGNG
jgi:hypothetical protein